MDGCRELFIFVMYILCLTFHCSTIPLGTYMQGGNKLACGTGSQKHESEHYAECRKKSQTKW